MSSVAVLAFPRSTSAQKTVIRCGVIEIQCTRIEVEEALPCGRIILVDLEAPEGTYECACMYALGAEECLAGKEA